MYLPPLGRQLTPKAVLASFKIMDSINRNPEVSRIENVTEEESHYYRKLGYKVSEKPGDYLYRRQDLAGLKGNKFKSQRAAYNYFLKNYTGEYDAYAPSQRGLCLKLYDSWQQERTQKSSEPLYRWMLEDSRVTLKVALSHYRALGLLGRVVKVNGDVKAFTFGYHLNESTFCILYEVADLSFKGIAQFVFRQFCRELEKYTFINAMDDSGLENLRKVKNAYRPLKQIRSYIITRDGSASLSKAVRS